MKKLMSMMKKYDYILIVVALILSFIPPLATHFAYRASDKEANLAVVKIHGEVVDEFVLAEDGDHQLVTYYPNPGQYNIIEIDGSRIRVKEDNSPDQIAVMTSWISQPGQLSICLPHNLMIEIRGQSQEAEDPLILPHF